MDGLFNICVCVCECVFVLASVHHNNRFNLHSDGIYKWSIDWFDLWKTRKTTLYTLLCSTFACIMYSVELSKELNCTIRVHFHKKWMLLSIHLEKRQFIWVLAALVRENDLFMFTRFVRRRKNISNVCFVIDTP